MDRFQEFFAAGVLVALVGVGTLQVGPPVLFDELWIASFNVRFLGNSPVRDDEALVSLFEGYDIVVVQELVSPPFDGAFPDGAPFRPDPDSAEFFDAMERLGFEFVLSQEDTGTNDTIHRNGSSTEWWVAFFNPDTVEIAGDLPIGFLGDDRSDHPDWERVPFAFPFRTRDGVLDFVLVSVHLKPGNRSADRERRRHELQAIARWVDENDGIEKDHIILGDMNFADCDELDSATPAGFVSLNSDCVQTNTADTPRPFDHVMYRPSDTADEMDPDSFAVLNLRELMLDSWPPPDADGAYPGDPYDHRRFIRFYSDHHPVEFVMPKPGADDD